MFIVKIDDEIIPLEKWKLYEVYELHELFAMRTCCFLNLMDSLAYY